jgi:hypothetical protein
MKSLLCLLLTGLLPLFSFAPNKATNVLSPKEKRQYALGLLQEYNPEGWYIIKMVDTLAHNNAFDRYAKGIRKAMCGMPWVRWCTSRTTGTVP